MFSMNQPDVLFGNETSFTLIFKWIASDESAMLSKNVTRKDLKKKVNSWKEILDQARKKKYIIITINYRIIILRNQ
jgi:hypothetical protein